MKRTDTLSLPIYELLDIFYIEDITESNVKIDEAINDLQETFNNTANTGALTTQEVVEARKGENSLKNKIEKIDDNLVEVNSQLAENVAQHSFLEQLKIKFVFGATLDGVTDDTIALQNYIDYYQNLNTSSTMYSNGSNNTKFGSELLLPRGTLKITSSIIINATNKTQASDVANSLSGISIKGTGVNSTIIDATSMVSGDAIIILGGFTKISDLQILNSKNNGINSVGWGNEFENVYVNNPAKDGIYITSGFKICISKCFVYNAKGYGFSFNDYHTSCLVENNYALQSTLGGYFVGNRDNMSLSKGMTYSEFSSNACDGGVNAYTFAGCRALEVNGCGCEVISNRAIYISGTECSVSINGFIGDRVTGNAIYVEGNRCKVNLNNYVDSNPINVATPLIDGGGTDAQIIVSNLTNKRTYLYGVANNTINIINQDNKNKKTITFDTQSKTIATLKHISGYTTNYSGLLIIRAFRGISTSPNSALNTTTYYLMVDKGAGGFNITTISSVGLKNDTTAPLSYPSFNFTFNGDNLIATHTTNTTWASGDYSFVIETTGEIKAT